MTEATYLKLIEYTPGLVVCVIVVGMLVWMFALVFNKLIAQFNEHQKEDRASHEGEIDKLLQKWDDSTNRICSSNLESANASSAGIVKAIALSQRSILKAIRTQTYHGVVHDKKVASHDDSLEQHDNFITHQDENLREFTKEMGSTPEKESGNKS